MNRFALEFLRRGFVASGIGPVILAIVYWILQQNAGVETLSVNQVCTGIFSITALAFIAGGMNAIYQIERMPLMAAILIHGGVLYISYLGIYLINAWLDLGILPIVVFSAVFVVGYIIIWAIIYSIIKRNTARLNKILEQQQKSAKEDLW